MAARGVVSYQRVSTKGQEFPRQKQARDQWLAKHPEYELLTTKRDLMSGRKENRFDWFIDDPVKYPAGTVLLVEDIDRFSRMEVEQGIRQLFAMFDRGLGIAVCPYFDDDNFWDRVGVITDFNGEGGEQIHRELKRARRESERKRERRCEARDRKYAAIREGNLTAAFKPRGKSKTGKTFPFWVEFDPKGNEGRGQFVKNEHWPLIERIWQLARTMGGARIAEVLMEEGFTSPYPQKGEPKLLSDEVVRNILRRRSAMGEFQPTTKGNKPNGDPIPGVFPPVVTPAEFNEIRGIIEERDTGLGHTKTKKQSNLFANRSFCANCGGLMGVAPTSPKPLADGSIKTYPGKFRCRVGHRTKGRACNVNGHQIGVSYEEVPLLQMLSEYRWEERYSSTAHDEEINQQRQHVLALDNTRAQKQRELENVQQSIEKTALEGGVISRTQMNLEEKLGAALIEAENAVAIAQNRLNALQSKTVGKAAAREARARVKAFMESGRDDLAEREKFNAWFHTTGLVVLVDPRTKQTHIGVGAIEDTRLVGFNPVEGALPAVAAMKIKVDGKAIEYNPFLEDLKARLAEFQKTGQMQNPEWFKPMFEQLAAEYGSEPWFQEIVNNPSKLPTFDPPFKP